MRIWTDAVSESVKSMKKTIDVVAGLIEKDGKYLIAKRATGNPAVINTWEFPGGTIEPLEKEEVALIRELKEEFDIEIEVLNKITHVVYEYPEWIVNLSLYNAKYISGEIKIDYDHSDYKWVTSFDDFEFAPADKELLKYIKKHD